MRSAVRMSLFETQERREKLEGIGDPLAQFDQHLDFAAITAKVDAVVPRSPQPKGGRPPYPTEVMVRLLVIQHLLNLSDEKLEFQTLDRESFRRFAGLIGSSDIPDRNTVWRFKERIAVAGAADVIFDEVNRQLAEHGYIARCGQIIDASIVEAPRQHLSREEKQVVEAGETPENWTPAKRRQKDPDASWTKKHGRSFHGYKVSVNIDAKYKVIRKEETCTAKESDSRHFESILDPMNTSGDVYADRGYASETREDALIWDGYRPHIQRKAKPGKPLGKRQKQRNRRIASPRARVEHVFAQFAAMGGKTIRTIGLKRAQFGLTMKAAVYNMKRLVWLREAGIQPT